MPIISSDGLFEFAEIRQSWAFEVKDSFTCMDGFAVPTSPFVNFDYAMNQPGIIACQHDLTHIQRYRGSCSAEEQYLTAFAKLNQGIQEAYEKNILSKDDLAKIDLAFFHIFHESSSPIEEVLSLIEKGKRYFKRFSEENYNIGKNFHSEIMLQVRIQSAEELFGKELSGNTLLEKYKAYNQLVYEGAVLLHKYAHNLFED